MQPLGEIRYREKQVPAFILPVPLFPKAAISPLPKAIGRGAEAGLLTYSTFLRPSRFLR